MQISRIHLAAIIAPALLVAQPSVGTTKSLVAEYAAMLKSVSETKKSGLNNPNELPTNLLLLGVSARLAHESNRESRQVLLVARHFLLEAMAPVSSPIPQSAGEYQSAVNLASGVEVAGQIPPNSPALDLVALHRPEFLGFIAWHASGIGFGNGSDEACQSDAYKYLDEVFKSHPSKDVKTYALASAAEIASESRKIPVAEDYVKRLESFNPNHPSATRWKQWLADFKYTANNPLKVGQVAPRFALVNLDRPTEILKLDTFQGKYLLLDFWATWCGPCKGELPFVHKAFAKYHTAGLEILSISCDRNADDISKFRNDLSHPMPWHHAFPQGKDAEDLKKAYQVKGIPHVLLVGTDGKILESGENLRGEKLDQVLAKYLKPKS